MDSSNILEGHIAQFINILQEKYRKAEVERIRSQQTRIQQAVQCFIEYPNLPFFRDDQAKELLLLMIEYDDVVDALKKWRGHFGQNILHLVFDTRDAFLIRTLVAKIGADLMLERNQLGGLPIRQNTEDLLLIKDMIEFQMIAKTLLISKRRDLIRPSMLLPYLDLTVEDKMKCEQILMQLSPYDMKMDEILCDIWYKAAQSNPSSDDVTMACKIFAILLQQAARYTREGLLMNMINAYPTVNVEKVLSSVTYWPRPYSPLVASFIRSNDVPYWIMQGILGTTLKGSAQIRFAAFLDDEDCNYKWIKNQLDKHSDVNETSIVEAVRTFDLFEELPEDIIYCLLSHLHFTQIIALSLTNKHVLKLVNESQHIWGQLGHKYFNELQITCARSFRSKYKSKFKTGKLLLKFDLINSIELNNDKVVLVESNGTISYLETNCLARPKKKKQMKKTHLKRAWCRSARLFKDHYIFVFTSPQYGDTSLRGITVINTEDMQQKYKIDVPFEDPNPYFTIYEKSFLAKGFEMDVASERISYVNWNVDLSKWIIRDGIIYGSEIVRYFSENICSTAWLKLFDQRTPLKLAAALHLQNFRCFNVSDHDIYAVTSHIMQWDKRFLSRPVRKSTDLYYYSKTNRLGYPAIDLTSMTVIGPDQIWDLTDFTWQLQRPNRVSSYITTNGILTAYSYGSTEIRQNPCTSSNFDPVRQHAELNCKLSSGHLVNSVL